MFFKVKEQEKCYVKHIHTLIINKVGKNSRKYIYDFGSTKNIELTLSETGLSIMAQLTKAYDKEEIGKRIEGVLYKDSSNKYNLTAYGYVLTQLAYYFRCKIVHGSKPVYLFSYGDDKELHSLKIINALLEEFIDNNLPLWFDKNNINTTIIPKTEKIELK